MNFGSPWLLAAVGFPIFNTIYLTAVITGLKTLEHSVTGYKTTKLQKIWADAGFKILAAGAFIIVGPITVALAFDPLYLLCIPLGILIYTAEDELWQWYVKSNPTPVERDLLHAIPLLIVPVAEEIVFRAGVGLLIDTASPAIFLAVSTVSFGLSHLLSGKKEVLFKLFDGLVYGVLFLVTGSLLAPVLTHVAHNATYAWTRGILR